MPRIARALTFLLCLPATLLAQEATNSTASSGDQLEVIRQMLQQQSKQIDVLAQEIARLNLLLESKGTGAAGIAPIPTGTDASTPAAGQSTPPESTPPESAPSTETPNPTPSGPVHVITKGETLTVIAKRYKVTVAELLKVNKIKDVRKLQIGQTLALPPDAKIPQSPSPKP